MFDETSVLNKQPSFQGSLPEPVSLVGGFNKEGEHGPSEESDSDIGEGFRLLPKRSTIISGDKLRSPTTGAREDSDIILSDRLRKLEMQNDEILKTLSRLAYAADAWLKTTGGIYLPFTFQVLDV